MIPIIVSDKLVISGFRKLIQILNLLREEDDHPFFSKGGGRGVSPIAGRGLGVVQFLSCDTSLDDAFIKSIELKVINGRKPNGYWTLETCMEDAALYTRRLDWAVNSSGACQFARNNGWMDECCAHMITDRMPKNYWTLELCKADALNYPRLTDWHQQSRKAYDAARLNGWFEECTTHMPAKIATKTWTHELIQASAASFNSPKEWNKGSPSAYSAAQRLGKLNEYTAHMDRKVKPAGYWNDLERCKTEALKYVNRSKWIMGSSVSYRTAKENGWMDECTAHMKPVNNRVSGHWNSFENCMASALEYTTRTEWCKGTPGAWYAAQKHGWLEQCVAHMSVRGFIPEGGWTLEGCKASALGYASKSAWHGGNATAFTAARKNGWLAECTAHMIRQVKD